MADEKHVLIIDDHFDMIEFLRSMVEISNENYQVTAVPSAEEGLLELRRSPFDLLITDIRLPGMSGFDLVRRMLSSNMNIPVIMITAYSSEQGKQEADELGVRYYFSKPLDTDEVLTAIQGILEGTITPPTPAAAPMKLVDITLPSGVKKRIETLTNDIRAAQLMLSTVHGQVLLDIGNVRDLDLPSIAQILANGLQNDYQLASQLSRDGSLTTIQYHAGDTMEVYTANIGADYFLAIFFDTATQRSRFGTIWVFAQRAIKDLLTLMPPLADAPTNVTKTAVSPPTEPEKMIISRSIQLDDLPPPASKDPIPVIEDYRPPIEPDYIDADPGELADFLSMVDAAADEADSFWDAAMTSSSSEDNMRGMTMAEAQAKGLIDLDVDLPAAEPEAEFSLELDDSGDELDALPALDLDPLDAEPSELAALFASESGPGGADLDAFWESAFDETDTTGSTRGMTLEEAQAKGLIPSEIDLDDNGS